MVDVLRMIRHVPLELLRIFRELAFRSRSDHQKYFAPPPSPPPRARARANLIRRHFDKYRVWSLLLSSEPFPKFVFTNSLCSIGYGPRAPSFRAVLEHSELSIGVRVSFITRLLFFFRELSSRAPAAARLV